MIGQISPEVFKAIGERSIPRSFDEAFALTCPSTIRLECVQLMDSSFTIRPISVLTGYVPFSGVEYYIVFSVCGFSNALVIWLFFPETAGVSASLCV